MSTMTPGELKQLEARLDALANGVMALELRRMRGTKLTDEEEQELARLRASLARERARGDEAIREARRLA